MPSLPTDNFKEFVSLHAKDDPRQLLLKCHGKDFGFDVEQAITQIECRKKCDRKLKSFIENPDFLFPNVLAAEQASHEAVAKFHASLLSSGSSVLDMTAGLGIDAMTIASKSSVTAIELDEWKAKVLDYNSKAEGLKGFSVVNADSVEWLKNHPDCYNVIFIDPARRGADNSRTYNLHDCQPDILGVLPEVLEKCGKLIIKASPLLDITQTLTDIPQAFSIRAVSVDGECKEVLVEATARPLGPVLAEAVNLSSDGDIIFRFGYMIGASGGEVNFASDSDIKTESYLYEPDASVMKLAPWPELTARFTGLRKLGKSTHLFVSDLLYPDFPGRVTRITGVPDKKSLKGIKANVVTRNYPLPPESLRKKFNIKEGKDTFLYGVKAGEKPMLILSERV